jgi:hypothetical protein
MEINPGELERGSEPKKGLSLEPFCSVQQFLALEQADLQHVIQILQVKREIIDFVLSPPDRLRKHLRKVGGVTVTRSTLYNWVLEVKGLKLVDRN